MWTMLFTRLIWTLNYPENPDYSLYIISIAVFTDKCNLAI